MGESVTTKDNSLTQTLHSISPPTRPYRYVILMLYSLATIINNISSYIFLPIQTTLAGIYGLNLAAITFFTNYISNITYLLGLPLSNYIADGYGLKPATLIATGFTLLGWWTSVACEFSFFWLVLGQILFGIVFPFFNMPQKLTCDWFSHKERDRSTSIFNVFYQLGASVGALIPQFFILENATNKEALDQIVSMLFWTSAGCTLFGLPIFFLFKSSKSHDLSEIHEIEPENKKTLKDLLKDWNYNILLLGSSLTIAANLALVGNIQPILAPYGISNNQVSTLITVGVCVSCIGTLIIGHYISIHKRYKLALIISNLGGTITLIGMMLGTIFTGNPYIIGVGYLLYQLFLSDIPPLAWELLIEIAYPANEATAGSLMMTIAQTGGALLGVAISYVLNNQSVESANLSFYIIVGFQLLATILILFVKEKLNRLRFELHDHHTHHRVVKTSFAAPKLSFSHSCVEKCEEDLISPC